VLDGLPAVDVVLGGFATWAQAKEDHENSGKATWNSDVVGMCRKVGNDVQHPGDAAKSLWHGVKNLF
jgi:hypothetical protein